MAIRCLFLVADDDAHCQVLKLLGAAPLLQSTQGQLQHRYCTSGAFIACPIFARVEQGLVEANRLRTQPPRQDPTPTPWDLSLTPTPTPG